MEENKTKIKKDLFRFLRLRKSDSKNAGITLIALVISIIVLIILASVAINTLINNGIVDKAKTAKEEYSNAQEYEENQIAKYSNEIDSQVNNSRDNITLSSEEYNELIERITNLENKSDQLGKTLYTGNFNSGSITVTDFDKYSYLIAICDWGWAIPLYKNSDGYMYGIGGRGGKTSNANDICIMGLSLSYSGNTLTYIEGKYGFLNGSNNNTNLSVKKLIGIY